MKEFLTVEHGGITFLATTEMLADLTAAGEYIADNPGDYGLILTTGGALHFNTLEEYQIIRDLVVLARRRRAEHLTEYEGVKIDTVEIEPEPDLEITEPEPLAADHELAVEDFEPFISTEPVSPIAPISAPEIVEADVPALAPESEPEVEPDLDQVAPSPDVQEVLDEVLHEWENAMTIPARDLMLRLTAKYAAAKGAEEYARTHGQMTEAMKHLKAAERYESGIDWNRPRLAEQAG